MKTNYTTRINARKTDVFDLFNFRYYIGPNPYLETKSLVFDFALTHDRKPLAIAHYASLTSDRYPHLQDKAYNSYSDLFTCVASQVGKLNLGLHLKRWSIKQYSDYTRIGVQSLDEGITRSLIYFVWDWLESITQNQEFSFELELVQLQERLSKSIYSQPEIYSLLQTADILGIPNFYLSTEELVQCGYGKRQIRGKATTVDRDSFLDAKFTYNRAKCQEFLGKLGFPVSEKSNENIAESNFCILCVNGKFIAALAQHLNSLLSLDEQIVNPLNKIHNDNIVLAQDIAQNFRLTCLGIDIKAESLASSWKSGNFSILGVHASPNLFISMRPTLGELINIHTHILTTFFHSPTDAKIPIITFNRISLSELETIVDYILEQCPDWKIAAICQGGIFINRSQQAINQDYNSHVQNLLRHPQLDLLIAEYPEDILEKTGMFYQGSNIVILDNPSETEMMLMRDMADKSMVILREKNQISLHTHNLTENHLLSPDQPLSSVYLPEISTFLSILSPARKAG